MPGGFYRQQMTTLLSPIVELRESPFSQIPPPSRRNLTNNANNENHSVDSYFPGTYERHDGVRTSFGSIRTISSTTSSNSERNASQFPDAEKEEAKLEDEVEDHGLDPSDLRGTHGVASAPAPAGIPNFSLPGRGTKRPIFPSRFGDGKIETIDWAYNVRDFGRHRSTMCPPGHWRNFSLPSNVVIRRASVS